MTDDHTARLKPFGDEHRSALGNSLGNGENRKRASGIVLLGTLGNCPLNAFFDPFLRGDMAQRHSDTESGESFLDLAADAVAAQHAFDQADRRVSDLRHALLAQLELDLANGRLGEGDVAVVETYVNMGEFDRARAQYRQRADTEGSA
jgi:hypothetical protein